MKSRLHPGRRAAILACAASLAGAGAILGPAAVSAHTATKCGNKGVKVAAEGSKAVRVPVKAISTEGGVTCAEAVQLIGNLLSGRLPPGWKAVPAHFKTPEGYFAQELKKGSKKVKFAIQGG